MTPLAIAFAYLGTLAFAAYLLTLTRDKALQAHREAIDATMHAMAETQAEVLKLQDAKLAEFDQATVLLVKRLEAAEARLERMELGRMFQGEGG